MNNYNKLYQKLSEIEYQNMYELESEFFSEFYYDDSTENQLPWINAFLTISSWFGTSMRGGVWTFYEATDIQEITDTLQYLKKNKDDELASVFEKGIHDYQNPIYADNYDYPEEWINESEQIDDWISEHEDWLWRWEYNLLMNNKESVTDN